MDPAAIREKYGVEPSQLIDVKSLMGDSSDNIPVCRASAKRLPWPWWRSSARWKIFTRTSRTRPSSPGQRAKLSANRDKADLSYMLGTIRKDAPIETDPAAYIRQSGDPAAAAQLLATLEMHKMVDRWGLEEGGTAAAPVDAAPPEEVEPAPLPLLVEGRLFVAQNADGGWYAVQGQEVYLPDTDRLAALLDSDAEIWAFDAKPLYRLGTGAGAYWQSPAF